MKLCITSDGEASVRQIPSMGAHISWFILIWYDWWCAFAFFGNRANRSKFSYTHNLSFFHFYLKSIGEHKFFVHKCIDGVLQQGRYLQYIHQFGGVTDCGSNSELEGRRNSEIYNHTERSRRSPIARGSESAYIKLKLNKWTSRYNH